MNSGKYPTFPGFSQEKESAETPVLCSSLQGTAEESRLKSRLKFIDDLAHKNSEALSFIPLPRLAQYLEAGQILLETENQEPCGYLVFGNGWPVLKVYQACIQYDARRMEHGLNLVRRLISIASKNNCVAISLWCADDIDANSFWKSAGFQFCGQREGGKRRGRKHNQWLLSLRTLHD